MESRTYSQGEPPSSAGGLRQYLERVLPDARLTTAPVHSKYEPLLLMQTTNVMAAFAIPNGDTDASYNVLYGGFKRFYLKQTDRPDDLDLAFVFCVRPDAPNLDILSSRVETDVYFCRKFVVRLIFPLNKSLARLPFLPLTPLDAPSLRPPSAQTFLQKCRVSATLAKFLVVQRERSPERIVTDCLSGNLGEPVELTPTANDPMAVVERSAKRTRLESIQIQGFRAYRKPQTFRLGSDVTVLYGPNGFGKTSLFDAIDFVVTGDIGRIKPLNDAHFSRISKHLDSDIKDSVVTLSFTSNGAMRKIERTVASRKHAKLDDQTTDRKAILAELTGGDFPSTDRVENFVSLFRATHLFSQEHQELMKDFHPHCELSENIVSRLLAFEDYANAANKTARICDILQTEIHRINKEIRELSQQILKETEEIDRLGRSGETRSGADELRNAMESLRGEITSAGISVETEGSELEVVRRWRAAIEVQRAATQSEIDRLTALGRDAAERPKVVAKIVRVRKLLDQTETALEEVRNKEIASVQRLRQAEAARDEVSAKRATTQSRAELLEWVRQNRAPYRALLSRERELAEELGLADSKLAEKRERDEVLGRELLAINSHANKAEQELDSKLGDLRALEAMKETAAGWQVWNNRVDELEETERNTSKSLEVLYSQERDIAAKKETTLVTEARLSEQIAEIDRGQSNVRRMLLELKSRVRTGMCLLCGEDYGSAEELSRRIDEQIEVDAASGARIELTRLNASASSLSEQLARLKQKRSAAEGDLEKIAGERSKLVARIRKFEQTVRKGGISVDVSTVAQIQERLDLSRSVVTRVTQEIAKLKKSGETIQAKLSPVRRQIQKAIATKSKLDAAMETIQGSLTRLRGDSRAARISLDIDIERLTKLDQLNTRDTTALNAKLESADTTVTQINRRVMALRQESENRQSELARLRNRVAKLNDVVAGLTARLDDANLKVDVEEDTVHSLVAVESRAQAELLTLSDRAVRLEQAIDRATTAAALAQLRQNVQEKQARVTQANQTIELHQAWLKFFQVIADLISSQRSEATEDFTREYGPRTSVIQRRLRSVYGFDEVEIHSHESTIRVRVRRRGEQLRPTDYFSQSQQQTLLLGLFLTTCISQTWSSLSSVLLDDPVTHFDNLNTYAFLDLIAGLVDSEAAGHQFILSTCDEKFFHLSRQRFRHLGERATFYSFSAIDEGGPVVEVLPTHETASSYT